MNRTIGHNEKKTDKISIERRKTDNPLIDTTLENSNSNILQLSI